MIKRIKKIKDLGIFGDFSWPAAMPDFERYNLIYGWNGCGKTTLSKLFACLEKGSHGEFPDLKYEIETDAGNFADGSEYNLKLKVFNEDYVVNNIELISGKAKPIFILGEENKLIAAQIAKDDEALRALKSEKKSKEELKAVTERARASKFTDIARVIGSNTAGSSVRTYRKNNAEAAFAELQGKRLLTEDEVNRLGTILKHEPKGLLNTVSLQRGDETSNIFDSIRKRCSHAISIGTKTVESTLVERLVNNPDLSEWVESGLVLHRTHESLTCEFCEQPIPENRFSVLAQHFNEADQKLKAEIDEVAAALEGDLERLRSISVVDSANFYSELQNAYESAKESLVKEKVELQTKLESLKNDLLYKKQKTTDILGLGEVPGCALLAACIDSVNSIIAKHNETTRNFDDEKNAAQHRLEEHYLSEIYDDVKDLEGQLNTIEESLLAIKDGNPDDPNKLGIDQLAERIRINKAKISSEDKACEVLNKQVATFLGHEELKFEVVKEGGYIIKRSGKVAKNLSEGEKTAIAFVYFVVHLQDQEFDINNGVVVIDDPISSLDSNSLFQAFAFLKNAVKDAKQVFIFTHNFEFMRLLLGWIGRIRNNIGKKRFLMITNQYSDVNRRSGLIAEMDPMLKDYETEYQYLFKKLYQFESDGTIENVYHIPNLARKTLETFLMFRVPNGKNLHDKLETLDFDEVKKTAIYKFTNDQSHLTGGGFDPSIVPETQNNVGHILEMIKAVSPEHFTILEEAIAASEI